MSEPSVWSLEKLTLIVDDIKTGLNPNVIFSWYKMVEAEVKKNCPAEYLNRIFVEQDSVLPMKFIIKAPKAAVPYLIDAIESYLSSMSFSTRLYFQKLEEIILSESKKSGAGDYIKASSGVDES